MNNYIEIEKYKVSYDSEGNEILTQVDVMEGKRTIKKSNYLNPQLRQDFQAGSGSNTALPLENNRGIIEGFKEYTIGISNLKVLTKAPSFSYKRSVNDEADFYEGWIVGTVPSDSVVTTETGTDIRTVAFKCRFAPPSTVVREINTIAVLKEDSRDDPRLPVFNNILLDAPCIQQTDELLIVNYRYRFSAKRIADSLPFSEAMSQTSPTYYDALIRCVGYMWNSEVNVVDRPTYFNLGTSDSSLPDGNFVMPAYGCNWGTLNSNPNVSRHPVTSNRVADVVEGNKMYYVSLGIGDLNGKLLNSINCRSDKSTSAMGNSQHAVVLSNVKFRGSLDSVVQNIYPKAPFNGSSTGLTKKPFYDLDNLPTSIGVMEFSESFAAGDTSYESVDNLAELIRVEITAGGATGTASYKLSTRYLTGFLNVDGWEPELTSAALVGNNYSTYTKLPTSDFKIKKGYIPDLDRAAMAGHILPLEVGEMLVYLPYETTHEDYGLWVHTLNIKDDYLHITPSTLAGYGAVDIRGVTTAEDGTIFVACAETGLWKLKRNKGSSVAAMTVSRVINTGVLDDTKCHAVNFMRPNHRFNSDGRIGAVFGNQLCLSEDGGENWSIYDSTSNPKFEVNRDFNHITGISGTNNGIEDIVILNYTGTGELLTLPAMDNGTDHTLDTVFWYKDRSDSSTSVNISISNYHKGSRVTFNYLISKGGGNNAFKGVINTDYPIIGIAARSNDYNNRLALYSPIDSTEGVVLPKQRVEDSAYGIACVLVDDIVNGSSYIIFSSNYLSKSGNTIYPLTMQEIPDAIVGNEATAHNLTSNANYSSPVVAGRGLILTSGKNLDADIYSNTFSENSSYVTTQAMLLSLIHIGYNSEDFYKDNLLNFWYEYSYNSARQEWELATDEVVNSKVSHTENEVAIKGLSLSINDSDDAVGNPSNFVVGEFFDQYVFDGVIKDDYTTIDFKFLQLFGSNESGNDFTPSNVPANPKGIVTEPLRAQHAIFWENDSDSTSTRNYSGRHITSNSIECTYSDQAGSLWGDNPTVGDIPLGEALTGDFTLETQITYSLSSNYGYSGIYATNSDLYRSTIFRLVDANLITGESTIGLSTLYGWRLIRTDLDDNGGQNKFYLSIFSEGMYTSVAIPDYNPRDVYKVQRVGNTLTTYRNGVEIHTTTLDVPSVRFTHRIGREATGKNRMGGVLLGLFNPIITYDSKTLKVALGNPTDKTGAYSLEYALTGMTEWLEDIKSIYLNGVKAVIIYDTSTEAPPAGSVRVNMGAGELIFNPADAGKTVTGDWRIVTDINASGEL